MKLDTRHVLNKIRGSVVELKVCFSLPAGEYKRKKKKKKKAYHCTSVMGTNTSHLRHKVIYIFEVVLRGKEAATTAGVMRNERY